MIVLQGIKTRRLSLPRYYAGSQNMRDGFSILAGVGHCF